MVVAARQSGTGYPLLELFWTMLLFFGFVVWIWLLIVLFRDIFHRPDMSGWAKAAWTVLVIVLPLVGVLLYLITQGKGMADRRDREVAAAQSAFDERVRSVAGNGGQPADQIAKAKQLLDSGDITRDEFEVLKRRALGDVGTMTNP